MLSGKRELLAKTLFWGGATHFLSFTATRNCLLVLNYHRIGAPEQDPFDPNIFSATPEMLEEQVAYLKKRCLLVNLEEAVAFLEGTDKTSRCRVLLTFDDGYLDNYQLAFPVLRSQGIQGVFFLATSFVGSNQVPWWDQIAYFTRTARRRRFSLSYPSSLEADLDQEGFTQVLDKVLLQYKQPAMKDSARFLSELKEATQADQPPSALRRFLDWQEAQQMVGGGMAIGSHTLNHPILSQLSLEQQREELVSSRELLRKNLGVPVDTLAYPVGAVTSFTEQTQSIAKEAGYRAAFSFHGGTNAPGAPLYDVRRIGVGFPSRQRFEIQAEICRSTGRYWP